MAWVDEQQEVYKNGKVGDVVIKRKLIEVLNILLDPIRTAPQAICGSPG